MKSKLVPALALAACVAGLSSQANADVWWQLKDVTFDDGGTLSGVIDVNVYGFLSYWSLTTTAGTHTNTTGGPLAGDTYTPSINSSINSGTSITFYSSTLPAYDGWLTLNFQDSLTTAESNNPIVGLSFECVGFTCPNGTETRYVTAGYAAVPEAPTWAMMIVGAGLLGLGGTFMRGRARLRAA